MLNKFFRTEAGKALLLLVVLAVVALSIWAVLSVIDVKSSRSECSSAWSNQGRFCMDGSVFGRS